MNRNSKIAAAVAAVLALGAAGSASAVPTQGAAASTTNVLYVSGSSAAKSGVLGAIEADFCGGISNSLVFSSTGDTNFFAVSCTPATSTGVTNANGTNVFTIYYRDEGGSVTGALPLVSGSAIAQLDLTQTATCSGNTCTIAVGGTTASNGTTDSFTGTTNHQSGLGITDVEPAALIGDNYPSAYSVSKYGSASASQLAGLTATGIFQQVFGIFINKTGLNLNSQGSICLTSAQVSNLLSGNITDWSKVEDCVSHSAVASSPTKVVIVNREKGSGTRTAASIYWLQDECVASASGVVEDQTVDYFSTGNVLTAAGTTNGAITYASIDNAPASGLVLASIDTVTPTNLAAAQGEYGWWEEATAVSPNYTIPAVESSIANFLISDLQNGNTAPHTAQVNLIPDSGSNTTPSLPVSGTANQCSNGPSCTVKTSTAIYTNPFTKAITSCAIPVSFL